jgi:hypothetical protein
MRTLAALLSANIAAAQPPAAHVWHLVVPDDIDTSHLADRITAELREAEQVRPRLLLLELSGDSGRWDLVARIAGAVADMTVPVAVLLDDARDRRVGVAQLVIGLASRGCALGERTAVRTGRDLALRALAPTDVAWGEVESTLMRVLEPSLAAAPEGLADIMLFPTSIAWAMPGDSGPWTITCERPAPDTARAATQIVWLEDRDTWSFRASPALLKDLGLPVETVRSIQELLRRHGVRGLSTRRVELAGGLREARARSEETIARIDRVIEDLRARLDLPADRSVALDTIRRRGRGIVADARAALDILAALEEDIRRFPELLREPAPGQTGVAGSASSYAAAWRRALQTRHDRLTRQLNEGQALVDR